MTDLVIMLIWFVAWLAIDHWCFLFKHVLVGSILLFAVSLAPMFYGRAITPPEWHDYHLMGLYYLPTVFRVLGALVVFMIGLYRLIRSIVNRRE